MMRVSLALVLCLLSVPAAAQAPPPRLVMLPAGIWIPPANLLPGDTTYQGVGPATVIQAADPDTEFLRLGPRSVFLNLSFHDVFGATTLPMLGKPNGPRYVSRLENARSEWDVSSHWAEMASFITGGTPGVDSPVTAVRCVGIWSACLFTEAHEKTYGLHTWSLDDAKGVLVEHFDRSTGIHVTAKAGSQPPFGSLTFRPQADVRSIHIQSDVPTTTDVQFVAAHKTAGSFVAMYQAVTQFGGSLFHANMGNAGGTFTGLIFDMHNAGQPVFRVTADGDVISGRLAERIAALEAAIATLQSDARK